jgi:hypothetical protein
MPTNHYFQDGHSIGGRGQQRLIEDLVIQAIKIMGTDIFYLPRTSVNPDDILGEDTLQRFRQQYPIEMYMANVMGFDGNGELFSKFGITVTDQATFVVSKRRWEEAVAMQTDDLQLPTRPAEGDLLFFPKTGAMFEIKFVKADNPFYQAGRIYVYTLTCELFLYSSERIEVAGDPTAEPGSLASKLNAADGPLAASQDTYNRQILTMSGGILVSMQNFSIIQTGWSGTINPLTANDDNDRLEREAVAFLDTTEPNLFGAITNREY